MISIVIPNFNGAKLLANNLPKLLGLLEKSKQAVPAGRQDYEVIVVDDGSTDESVEILKQVQDDTSFKRGGLLKVISKTINEGFASTVDAGIREAKGEIVFALKTDAVPERADYFQLMLGHFKDPKVFSVSAALHTIENGKLEVRGQGVLIFFRGFFLHFRTHSDYIDWLQTMRTTRKYGVPESVGGPSTPLRSAQDVDSSRLVSAWADGSAMAVRRDLYLKIGGFDGLYNPFYWEDVDLGYRAWKAGYRIDFESKAILRHNFESGAISKHYTKEQVKIISLRNQFIFVWKNGDTKHLVFSILYLVFHFAVALRNGNWLFFGAFYQAVSRWPEILSARIRQKRVARLSDDQALDILVS